ncbi:hypothetical protein FVE85_2087 [Porphyridium purpureum]|uniref:Uncharacterized protein n=1 Tax=Porphyridium purpureum TaxID=35688 RepID=A0A5J4YYH0_PORPP|nr:hypothetical protein FVE85_2087 [Porphyridium purpureum]|eukprot:POR3941..scf209_3
MPWSSLSAPAEEKTQPSASSRATGVAATPKIFLTIFSLFKASFVTKTPANAQLPELGIGVDTLVDRGVRTFQRLLESGYVRAVSVSDGEWRLTAWLCFGLEELASQCSAADNARQRYSLCHAANCEHAYSSATMCIGRKCGRPCALSAGTTSPSRTMRFNEAHMPRACSPKRKIKPKLGDTKNISLRNFEAFGHVKFASGSWVAENLFWNIRGSFKLLHLIDVGTHMSLVKCRSGQYVLLDAVSVGPNDKEKLLQMTQQGSLVSAIINVHPFHTVYVAEMHKMFPTAKVYGTARHKEKLGEQIKFEKELVETPEFAALFKDDLEFSVSEGLRLVVPGNDNVHAGSVVAYHPASKTLHVDDTLGYFHSVPRLIKWTGLLEEGKLDVHAMYAKALEPRAGAGADFLRWLESLPQRFDVQNVCTAHTGNLLASENKGASFADRISAIKAEIAPKLGRIDATFAENRQQQ